MKKSIFASLLLSAALFSCSEEDTVTVPSIPPLDGSSYTLQVPLYSTPDVYEEGFNHHTQQVEEVKLSYNRQVFVDLDAASLTSNADTLGYHYNDEEYVKFDVWDTEKDHAEGSEGWDIVLAYYNGKAHDGTEYVPYMMTGALVNKGETKAIRLNKEELEEGGETFISYDEVSYADAMNLTLSSEVDAIGSDWKALDFATFTYKIVENQYYIIETTDGVFFKLAFTGFYNDDLEQGYPAFKFQRLIAE
ncbi:HmuY family protein [Flammeovirga sp. OC4]|uniref:HmuY family protein n=1 Tax=Flammeovirga sp. OC4 TaxID=1382345 RepID=UPI0005C7149C|nr:HmuY family protein [Flammeovirga sp. OC4]